MDRLRNAFKYLMKAYFGGCIGCLGALSTVIALMLLPAVVLGPQDGGRSRRPSLDYVPVASIIVQGSFEQQEDAVQAQREDQRHRKAHQVSGLLDCF